MKLVSFIFVLVLASPLYSQNFNISEIPSELMKDANSVVRKEKTTINILDVDKLEKSYYGAYTILNKNGQDHFYPVIPYDKEVKIRSVELKVYDKNGEEIEKFKKRDFLDISAVSEVSLYSDNRALIKTYTPKEYPYTLELSYEIESDDTAFLPEFMPITTYNNSAEFSSYTITVSESLKLSRKIMDPMGLIEEKQDGKTYHYRASNLKAIEDENQSPGFDGIAPRVLFSLNRFSLKGEIGSAESWDAFGKWMYQRLLTGVSELPATTKAKIKELVKGVSSPLERARIVYEFMQDRTRYISVQVGLGGWKPMPAGEVDRLGYGDCKALTNYTKALLEVAEVPSYYSIVQSGAKKENIHSDFTSIQGDHVILAIPNANDFIWLECTSQDKPFGYLGDFTDDRDVVLVTPEGGKLAHTYKFNMEESVLATKGLVELDSEGNIDVTATLISEGIQYEHHYFIESKREDERNDYYKTYWRYIDNMAFNSIRFKNDKSVVAFEEEVSFIAGSYASFAGDKMLFNVNILNRSTYIPKRYKNRVWPLYISRGYYDKDEVTIKLPAGFMLTTIPEPRVLETKFGSYHSEIEMLPSGDLLYKRELKIMEGSFPKEDYKAYRNFRKEVARNDDQKIILIKS